MPENAPESEPRPPDRPVNPLAAQVELKPYTAMANTAIVLTVISIAFNPFTVLSVVAIVLCWIALRRIKVARSIGQRVPIRGLLIGTLVVAILSTFFTGWSTLHLLGAF